MNDARVRRSLRPIAIGLACLVVLGCGGSQWKSQRREQSNLKKLALVYGRFEAQHRGRPPASEAEFKDFVHSLRSADLAALGVTDPDTLFISPRDGKPYTVVYGRARGPADPVGIPLIAYEQDGKAGKRMVVSLRGDVEEVDRAHFGQNVRSSRAP